MNVLNTEIIQEIHKLRNLKQSMFDRDFVRCDVTVSNICLSADVLLIPLYWYLLYQLKDDTIRIEGYMIESINSFKDKADSLIPTILRKTADIDRIYPSKPFQSYLALLQRCFPQFCSLETT